MADYVTLLGSEDVRRAGYEIRSAAESMGSAASSISHSLEMHQRFLDDWLLRLQNTLEAARPTTQPGGHDDE